jgi:serine protease Do
MTARDKEPVKLVIDREGERRTITVRLVPEGSFFNADLIRTRLGLSVQEMTPQLARHFAFGSMEGLLIAGVEKGSPAAAAELDNGMLITGIDGQSTTSTVNAAKIISPKKNGDKVRIDVVFPRQRGAFIEFRQGTVELKVRGE